jgi:hypothetical protein
MVYEVDQDHKKIGNLIHFGASEYSDFTKHKDNERKRRYLDRHSDENWSRSGIDKPGFWSRWILWNKPTINESIEYTEKRFNIDII